MLAAHRKGDGESVCCSPCLHSSAPAYEVRLLAAADAQALQPVHGRAGEGILDFQMAYASFLQAGELAHQVPAAENVFGIEAERAVLTGKGRIAVGLGSGHGYDARQVAVRLADNARTELLAAALFGRRTGGEPRNRVAGSGLEGVLTVERHAQSHRPAGIVAEPQRLPLHAARDAVSGLHRSGFGRGYGIHHLNPVLHARGGKGVVHIQHGPRRSIGLGRVRISYQAVLSGRRAERNCQAPAATPRAHVHAGTRGHGFSGNQLNICDRRAGSAKHGAPDAVSRHVCPFVRGHIDLRTKGRGGADKQQKNYQSFHTPIIFLPTSREPWSLRRARCSRCSASAPTALR